MSVPAWVKISLTSILSLALTLVCCEVAFRSLLFSHLKVAQRFQHPEYYFNYFSDDEYWVLSYLFREEHNPTGTHPVLGWSGSFDPVKYVHFDTPKINERRPVLLYGDSFASCVTKKCFQDYFNEDPQFSKKCYFLNFGVGAHGIDQTYLIFHNSLQNYKDPFVIYSLMTQDTDRAVLSVFEGQKPYFIVENNQLVLKGVPVDPSPKHFFSTHKPKIFSYLFRFFYKAFFKIDGHATDPKTIPRVQNITKVILKKAIDELRESKLNFMFLVFIPNWEDESDFIEPDEKDWRLKTITNLLKTEKVPYLVTKDLVRQAMISQHIAVEKMTQSDMDGHPSDLQNQIIFEGLKKMIPGCSP